MNRLLDEIALDTRITDALRRRLRDFSGRQRLTEARARQLIPAYNEYVRTNNQQIETQRRNTRNIHEMTNATEMNTVMDEWDDTFTPMSENDPENDTSE